jgi:hypothetical protein
MSLLLGSGIGALIEVAPLNVRLSQLADSDG